MSLFNTNKNFDPWKDIIEGPTDFPLHGDEEKLANREDRLKAMSANLGAHTVRRATSGSQYELEGRHSLKLGKGDVINHNPPHTPVRGGLHAAK